MIMASRNFLTFFVYSALMVVPVALVALHDFPDQYCGPVRFYHDLRCEPITYDVNDCPVRYNCDHLFDRSPNFCYVNRNVYANGEKLKPEDLNTCESSCKCRKSPRAPARISCDITKCPVKHIPTNHYTRRSLDKCCNEEILHLSQRNQTTCTVDGRTYYDGEKFRYKNEQEVECVCQPGYKENIFPQKHFCVERKRHIHTPVDVYESLGSKKCAPVFKPDVSIQHAILPRKTRCKDENDFVISYWPAETVEEAIPDELKCVYGDLLLKVGDEIGSTSGAMDNYKCVCELPPFVTCQLLKDDLSEENSFKKVIL